MVPAGAYALYVLWGKWGGWVVVVVGVVADVHVLCPRAAFTCCCVRMEENVFGSKDGQLMFDLRFFSIAAAVAAWCSFWVF